MQRDSASLSFKLRRYMQEHRCTQSEIADIVNVNQATVSRFLKKPPQRVTTPYQQLCNYAESLPAGPARKRDQGAARNALEICWNKSEAHARAASKILDALAELCRNESDDEVAPG